MNACSEVRAAADVNLEVMRVSFELCSQQRQMCTQYASPSLPHLVKEAM